MNSFRIQEEKSICEKLSILSDAAKYDVACTFSGIQRSGSPFLREHRLYQADWLMRYYHFSASELLSDQHPNFNALLDPKCGWALRHPEIFPVEINRADYQTLLRVPGIGYISAGRIVRARRMGLLDFPDLKKMGIEVQRK